MKFRFKNRLQLAALVMFVVGILLVLAACISFAVVYLSIALLESGWGSPTIVIVIVVITALLCGLRAFVVGED